MNITLSVDEKTVESARAVARQQGTSLNALIREYIEHLAGQRSGEETLAEFEATWAEVDRSAGGSGKKFSREELYAERLERYRGR